MREAKKARGWDDFTLMKQSEEEVWVTDRAIQESAVAARGQEDGVALADDNSTCTRQTHSTGAHLIQG